MNMQDNEMDNLFRSKLEGFEMEPSAHVWDNISREIGQPQQRKSMMPMLRIAASVAILISAGLYFLPKNNQVEAVGTKGPKMAVTPVVKKQDINKSDVVKAVQPGNPAVNVIPAVVKTQPTQQIANVVHRTNKVQPATVNTPDVTIKPEQVKATVVDQQQQALIANNTANDKIKAVPNPAIPDVKIIDNTVPTVKPEIIAAVQPDKDEVQSAGKKRRAKGLGGFLNKVIAAVDKRDDKIIEFTDTDEGDAITGINLGIIKVKKQK